MDGVLERAERREAAVGDGPLLVIGRRHIGVQRRAHERVACGAERGHHLAKGSRLALAQRRRRQLHQAEQRQLRRLLAQQRRPTARRRCAGDAARVKRLHRTPLAQISRAQVRQLGPRRRREQRRLLADVQPRVPPFGLQRRHQRLKRLAPRVERRRRLGAEEQLRTAARENERLRRQLRVPLTPKRHLRIHEHRAALLADVARLRLVPCQCLGRQDHKATVPLALPRAALVERAGEQRARADEGRRGPLRGSSARPCTSKLTGARCTTLDFLSIARTPTHAHAQYPMPSRTHSSSTRMHCTPPAELRL